ncbi:MAG TPA: ATP-dependent 6-phosphofructokinase [Gemmatimonadales bacterium]|nr:ATP-dependent 6-phosphofructokinase [Gemmatimonadales bacterium]
MKRVAVLTSGGDAPGMNAAIRAVVRTGVARGLEVLGVRQGYSGLIEGALRPLGARDVAGIIQLGGTMLGSARCPEFKTPQGPDQALQVLAQNGVDALIVIGGNGSLSGAHALAAAEFSVVGVASTIDNDVNGADITIGVDTALNIALEAIDRLKTTASSHQRGFVVEVMGRDCGYLALMAGIAGGADVVVIPEVETDPEAVAAELRDAYTRGKRHAMVVVAEGARWNAAALVGHFASHRDRLGFELRATTLGHVQRGGAPGAFDRLLASRTGAAAVDHLLAGETGIFAALVKGVIAALPLERVLTPKPPPDPDLVRLARRLAR